MAWILRWTILLTHQLCVLAQSSFSGVWHLVDVYSVVCPGFPGYTIVNMSQPADKLHSPHIFTIFRTTNEAVKIAFTATDSNGKEVASESADLKKVARRLALEMKGRQLSARRRGGGGSYSSPRRRAPTSYSSPRRRAPSPAPSPSYSSPRRRAPAPASGTTTARRRGYTEPPSQRRRTAGYDNKYYTNPSNPAAGNYGYTSASTASSNFGGRPPTSTPYGYTGANAYSGSSGSAGKIALAAGGGLLAGYAASQLFSHTWTGYNREQLLGLPCTSGSWTGTCDACVKLHGEKNCAAQISPKIDATRDDLLNTGFIPADFTWPIHVKITEVSGTDFGPQICPPTTPGTEWNPPSMKQLFLTLTTLEELSASAPAQPTASPGMSWWPILSAILVLVCCCCCLAAAWSFKSKQQDYGTSSESDYSSESDHGAYGASYGYGQPGGYGAQVQPQPQGYNPYWQGGPAQGGAMQGGVVQGGVVQGSVVGGGMVAGAGMAGAYGMAGSPHGAAMAPYGMGSPSQRGGGFMTTAAPNGASWADYCRPHGVAMNGGMVAGPWGECLAWAVAYEHQHPGWEHDPRFQEGPAAQVIQAMTERASDSQIPEVLQACETLEEACRQAIQRGQPLPIINQRI
ncbi:unnamed protein product [Effrenium voratum]|uniref:Uncharacterized protein n=1 Tax=Effrenium voratum TaxID=2562239 RepID=A0AA36J6S8_9DINO|nr:unnamed protein product [Effrenium voratum]CAJ1429866.1 unnamed protein product [Effrenium voratum]